MNFIRNMKAIRVEKFGPPNVLQLQNVEIPKVTSSKVLVKLMFAGVNPVDTYIREGAFLNLPDLPFTPGKDGAGVIEKIGENVTNFKVGERVFVCGRNLGKYGTYAEYSLVDDCDVFPLGNRLTFAQGAALGVPYFTAYRALVLQAKCKKGDFALIHGASGAVGIACIQLAKNLGLTVIGTAGTPEGINLVKECGADYVLCHREKNYLGKVSEITDNKGVNIIIEMLANVNLDKDLDIISARGRIAIVGSRGQTKIDPRKILATEVQVMGVALLRSTSDEWESISKAVVKSIEDGWINPFIDKSYSLEKASDAHKDIIHSKGAKGKLVLSISQLTASE